MSVSELEGEVERLRSELALERELRTALEGECDVLAQTNVQLERELSRFRTAAVECAPLGSELETSLELRNVSVSELAFDGDGRFANKVKRRIEHACGGMSVLAVTFCRGGELGNSEKELLACGGSDNSVSIYDPQTGERLDCFALTAPVLMLDAVDCLLAASLMDGSVVIIDMDSRCIAGLCTGKDRGAGLGVVALTLRHHTKYAVAVRWSPDGRFLASCSYDKSVCLYSIKRALQQHENEGQDQKNPHHHLNLIMSGIEATRITTMRLNSSPESIVFVPAASANSDVMKDTDSVNVLGFGQENGVRWELVIAARDRYTLIHLDCDSHFGEYQEIESDARQEAGVQCRLRQSLTHLNEHSWDTHVSFAPLALALLSCPQPSSRSRPHQEQDKRGQHEVEQKQERYQHLLLVATDKHLHFLTPLHHHHRLRRFAGHNCGDYGKPRMAFAPNGQYLYGTSEGENGVCVWDVASGAVVGWLGGAVGGGHTGPVKDICCSRLSHVGSLDTEVMVATGSIDHSVIIWTHA